MTLRALLLIAVLWCFGAQAAEPVAVRAAPHDGYGRIVFDWKAKSEYEATLAGRTLTVRFARPLTAKLDLVEDRLPDHVASVRLGPDGQTVVVALKGAYRLRESVWAAS